VSTEVPTDTVQRYMVREDRDIFGGIRSCAPCPAVFVLKDDPHVYLDKQWQFYIRAINYNQELKYVIANFGFTLAYCNGTGFGDPADPRANFLTGQRLDQKLPQFDKVRTNSRSVLTGVEQYSLVQAIKDAKSLVQSFLERKSGTLRTVRESLTAKNMLKVTTFDGRKPPPLKPGRSYPDRVEDVNIDDYVYNPQLNREMFLVCNIVRPNGSVVQFDNGGLYSWTGDSTPYTFLPHISNPQFGDVTIPLSWLQKLPIGSPIPSPYRRL